MSSAVKNPLVLSDIVPKFVSQVWTQFCSILRAQVVSLQVTLDLGILREQLFILEAGLGTDKKKLCFITVELKEVRRKPRSNF